MLRQLNLEGRDKVQEAIARLRGNAPDEGYYLTFSGGKDSIVLYDLTARAGVPFDAHYNVSPIDPPEIYEFIRQHYPSVQWDRHAKGFWKRFLSEGPPTRLQRWCCGFIKEAGGRGRFKLTGIRWEESVTRRSRTMYERCWRDPDGEMLHPIIDWTAQDVWEYIRERHLPYCPLYDEGFKRIGCVLCPFDTPSEAQRDIERFPRIAANWYRAFERYYAMRIQRGTPLTSETVEEYWQWWLSRKSRRQVGEGQIEIKEERDEVRAS